MKKFNIGDRVRVTIPDSDDVDHKFDQEVGVISNIEKDELSGVTRDPSHDYIYTVEFEDEDLGTMKFRYDDLESV